MLIRRLYTSLLTLATPLLLARLLWKRRANPGYGQRIHERFARIPPLPQRPRLWVHAVSVGEVSAAAPLIRAWQARHPHWAVLVTTTTPTGSAQVQRLFGTDVEHVYFPYDLPTAVRRFFTQARPSLGVIMETELWPNLMAESRRQGVPMLLANARLSARSMRGYARLQPLVRSTLGHFALIAARGHEDAQRFIALGAPEARVVALGNLKFDLDLDAGLTERGRQWRQLCGSARPVWMAASTHAGEEVLVLQAHRQVLAVHPEAMLLLAPRHPERRDDIIRLLKTMGLSHEVRSRLAPDLTVPPGLTAQVLLIDSLGELLDFYAASDIAFVGGSLVAHGGHNPLEPAALGLPVLTGPHVHNFSDVFAAMRATGAAREVMDAHALGVAVAELLGEATLRRSMGEAGATWLAAHRGALERLLARLESLAGAPPPAR